MVRALLKKYKYDWRQEIFQMGFFPSRTQAQDVYYRPTSPIEANVSYIYEGSTKLTDFTRQFLEIS